MTTRVILDTDIGTDVDDCLALALILCAPELELVGVTCVYGDVLLRARMVLKFLKLRGRTDVPVMVGATRPLLDLQPIYWLGHEGKGLLDDADEALAPSPEHAVDFIVRTVMEDPGQIHLITIGPMTNAALAFLREPCLAQNLAHLTVMGSVLRGPANLHLPYSEHNVRCDAEAAHVVLSAGAPTTLIPLDVTEQVKIYAKDVARIRARGTPFHEAVADQVDVYPYFHPRGYTYLHDPLAVATLIRPDLVTTRALHVDVETAGRHTAGVTLMRVPSEEASANAQVALAVDVQGFEEFLVHRLAEA